MHPPDVSVPYGIVSEARAMHESYYFVINITFTSS